MLDRLFKGNGESARSADRGFLIIDSLPFSMDYSGKRSACTLTTETHRDYMYYAATCQMVED
jgi:hypothetical protein